LPGHGSALAEPPPLLISASRQFAFAEDLFRSGQYRQAAEEFQRFVFFFPDDEKRPKAEFQTAESFRMAGDLTKAIRLYHQITARQLDDLAVKSYFMLSECYLQMRAYNQALLPLHNLIALSENSQILDEAYYRMGWIFMDQGDWPGAQRAWERISADSPFPTERLKAALETAPSIPQKSPAIAGTLSVIPGLGQLYLGRHQDALVAFTVTGGSLWASYEAFDNDLPVLGTLLALVGAGFYAGNFYGAISGAHKYNRSQTQQYLDRLKREAEENRTHSRIEGENLFSMQLQINIHF
jgi:hypothetical protein